VREFLVEYPDYELVFKERLNWALKRRAPGA
jgi:hypothetical protein